MPCTVLAVDKLVETVSIPWRVWRFPFGAMVMLNSSEAALSAIRFGLIPDTWPPSKLGVTATDKTSSVASVKYGMALDDLF
jgi:hypothetical protein